MPMLKQSLYFYMFSNSFLSGDILCKEILLPGYVDTCNSLLKQFLSVTTNRILTFEIIYFVASLVKILSDVNLLL